MRPLGIYSITAGLLVLLAGQPGLRAEPGQAPDFKEVYDLIRAHLPGVSEKDLDRAAVQGLVAALSPRVLLVTNPAAANPASAAQVRNPKLYENDIAYLRVEQVEDGLAKAVREAYEGMASSNKLKGVVLDLRYAGGDDYAAAAAVADLFVRKERPLLDWGTGVTRSKEKTDAIAVPVAVLVNRETSAAAEALAAVLREAGAGLVLGSQTAGQAMIAEVYPLKDGEHLRIATTPIQLGDGTALSAQGVKPDILVEVSPQDERAYFADAFKVLSRTNLESGADIALTNQTSTTTRTNRRPRFNEAELVRERRDGITPEAETASGREADPEKPLVQDPALARALDVLKGLAVVRQLHS